MGKTLWLVQPRTTLGGHLLKWAMRALYWITQRTNIEVVLTNELPGKWKNIGGWATYVPPEEE